MSEVGTLLSAYCTTSHEWLFGDGSILDMCKSERLIIGSVAPPNVSTFPRFHYTLPLCTAWTCPDLSLTRAYSSCAWFTP